MAPYLDHNATTPLRPEARARWLEVQDALGGNPSSLHRAGRRARAVLDEAREQVAAALGCHEGEILFTSGGTEADNLALFGVLGACAGPASDAGLAISAIEHAAVRAPAHELARRGHPLFEAPVDAHGELDPGGFVAGLPPQCKLVSLQAANNELGSLFDLAKVREALARRGGERPWFHTDAVQALGRIAVDLDTWGVDLASFSAHKVGGPVGVGVLVQRAGVPLRPLLYGGGQEAGLRPGTEDAAGIAAAACAIELAVHERPEAESHTRGLTEGLWRAVHARRPDARLLGPHLDGPRLPNTLSLLLPGLDGRVLVTRLDLAGLAISAGSACASGSLEPSHVLRAIGLDERAARSGVRVSIGRSTSLDECKRAAEILCATEPPSHAT